MLVYLLVSEREVARQSWICSESLATLHMKGQISYFEKEAGLCADDLMTGAGPY